MKLNHICFLDAATFGVNFDFSELRRLAPVTIHSNTDPQDTLDRIKGSDIVITNKVGLDEAVLSKATELKLICVAATGTNNIDLKFADSRGIQVCNAVGYSTHSVAQHCMALCLELIHRNRQRHRDCVKNWSKAKVFSLVGSEFDELSSKRWGILGLGSIGSQVAKLACAFGSEVVYHSVSGKSYNSRYLSVSFEELLRTSDVLSVHTSLRSETMHLLNHKEFELLKPDVLFLNMARGQICEPNALITWLKSGKFLGVGLDVLDREPPSIDHALLNVRDSRLLITPHMAWTSRQSRHDLLKQIVRNIESYQREEALVNTVRFES